MRSAVVSLTLALPFLMGADLLKSRNRAVEEGNARMNEGKAEEALGHYDNAAARLPGEAGVHFNRGTALYGLSRWKEAAQAFLRATEAKTPSLKATAFYNLGNSLFQAQEYGEAVEAYKKSLSYDPTDVRAKWNLELALKKKKEEDKKKQEENDKNKENDKNNDKQDDQKKQDEQNKQDDQAKGDQQKDQNKQDDQAKDDQKDQKKQDEQAKNDQQKDQKKQGEQAKNDQQKEQKKQDEKQAQQKPGQQGEAPADMREIDAILDSLERSPKALEQERARIRAVRRAPPVKDW